MQELFFDVGDLPAFFSKERIEADSLFVFSTDVVKDSWIDWIVSHPEQTGVRAVALEKFTAWDKFKGDFASSRDKDSGRGTVPALLRKLFVSNLIRRNRTEKCFRSLIESDYADEAFSFTDWITSMLSPLHFWHERYRAFLQAKGMSEAQDTDAENQDLCFLYREYADFLDSLNLYEPSWIEPDFTGKADYYIIYPELLEDFSDYSEAFRSASNVTAVHLKKLPEGAAGPDCCGYADSRMELRRTLLRIRQLVGEQKARWQDISVSIPDMDLYRPYVEREAEKYCVPIVIHAGESLLKSSAAAVFSELYDCYSSRFSYDSMRTLLLDAHIPWKQEFRIRIENLVREGCQMHCVCQYDGRHDIWEESLSATSSRNEWELAFYKELKANIDALCKADSFAHILSAWMKFRSKLLEPDDFSSDANLILGRCVEELKKLILIWDQYVKRTGLALENPYEFFLTELKTARYAYQDKSGGVKVYPYRLSAGAAFKYQFVIDASQSNLEVPVRRLSFLSAAKRQELGLLELEKAENPSVPFIRLYAGLRSPDSSDSSGPAFSFAQNSFSGFAIAHSFLNPVAADRNLDAGDFIAAERTWFLSGGEGEGFAFSGKMQEEALRWLETGRNLADVGDKAVLKDKILSLVMQKRGSAGDREQSAGDGRIRISQSDLRDFFPCQRYWLFNRLFRLDEDSLTGDLSGPFDIGNINHKVLERFMRWRMEERGGMLPVTADDGSFGAEEQEIFDRLRQFAGESIDDYSMDFRDSILSRLAFRSQKDAVARMVLDCLHAMCRPEEEKKLSFGGWGIFAAEQWLSAEGGAGSWACEGKVDCILKDGLGNLAIVDYKSGNTPTVSSCIAAEDGSLGDFQMPMYVKLCEESGQAGDIEAAAFYSIKGAAATVIVQPREKKGRSKSVDREEFGVTMDAFQNYSKVFYEKLSSGNLTPVAAGGDAYNAVDSYADCTSCPFKTVCRTAFRVAGRKLAAK